MRFWLGTHAPSWLAETDVPLMVSHRRLARRRGFPRAQGPWVLDSGGFTELGKFGGWSFSPDDYAAAVGRYQREIGQLEWAAPQDWLCDPGSLARTGLSVEEHQRRTIESYLQLRSAGPFIPMLQGWTGREFFRHAEMYQAAGVDLAEQPIVGLGSIAQRGAAPEVVDAVHALAADGLRLHGFGVKRLALRAAGHLFASADSMAWSYRARREPPLAGCSHRSCGNCLRFALAWRAETLELAAATPRPDQLQLPLR